MRGRAEHGNSIAHAGERIAGSHAAADVRGARRQNPSLRSVRPARSELDDVASAAGLDQPRALGCDQRLERDGGEQPGLGNLRLDERGADGEHGLPGEQRSALGDGEQVTSKPKIAQVLEKCGGDTPKLRQPAQVVDLFPTKANVEKILGALREARGKNEVTACG